MSKLPQVPGALSNPMAKIATMQKQQNIVHLPQNNAEHANAALTKSITEKLLARLSARR